MYALDGLSECSVQEIFQNLPDPPKALDNPRFNRLRVGILRGQVGATA